MDMSLKNPSPFKRQPFQKTIIALSLALFAVGLYVVIKKPTLTPPAGIRPLKSVDLHQIEGPWFEVARLSSPMGQEVKDPLLFIKYAGKGGDFLPSYPDPEDPRLKLIYMGTTAQGQKETVWSEMSDPIKDYKTGTLRVDCWGFIPCAFHLINYDEDQQMWMVIAGPFKNQLWIFSRTPGLLPDSLNALKKKLAHKGYEVGALTYSNELPRIPDIMPKIPEVLPHIPKMTPRTSSEK